MPGNLINSSGKIYLHVVGGNLVQTVDKETPNARKREYERKDGTMGTKWELVYMNWEGVIGGLNFKSTDYGDVCEILFEDAVLTLPTNGRYFMDFASKIMSADVKKPVLLHPFDMEGDNGKRRKGISVQQNGNKLPSYYYDKATEAKLHGFPEVDQEKSQKKTYWTVYFAEVEEFLIEELTNKFKKDDRQPEQEDEVSHEEPTLDDLPFLTN